MTIETKYNIGDEVWCLIKDEPRKFTVNFIKYERGTVYYGLMSAYGLEFELPERNLSQRRIIKELMSKVYKFTNVWTTYGKKGCGYKGVEVEAETILEAKEKVRQLGYNDLLFERITIVK